LEAEEREGFVGVEKESGEWNGREPDAAAATGPLYLTSKPHPGGGQDQDSPNIKKKLRT
jgi:hypothetical protein